MSSPSFRSVEISDLTIKAPTNIALIKVSIEDTFQQNFDLARGLKETTLTLTSRPNLQPSAPLIVKVRLAARFGSFNRSNKIEIKHEDLLSNASTVVATDKREYRRTTVNGIEVIVGFTLLQTSREAPVANPNLTSTTDDIFEICPRFRVLVIGRTGAGKTSLINNTFGVTEAHISHSEVGESDINKELFSFDENRRFVLHDSKGFEPGDVGNFELVMKFLNERKEKPDIKDQVHAVWLCFSIPMASDRLFETGAETFLQLLSEGQLGRMPIIAIFTKYDKLVDHIDFYDNPQGNKAEVEAKAQEKLGELCVKPFQEQISGKTNIPVMKVSTKEEYKKTLHELTQRTTHLVGEYLTEDVAVLSAVAQQVSPSVKLDAVIAVGKKRYWQGLTTTIQLPGNELQIVLQNIHQDIVRIWNLQDPKELLDSMEFKMLVVGIGSNDYPKDVLTIKKMTPSLSMLAALAGIVSALSGPAAPIVIPIAAVFVAGHWTALLLKQSRNNLQRLMTYIVSLTLIMQIIFTITTSTNNVVSRRLIKLALKVFNDSSQNQIFCSIKEHLQRPFAQFGRDASLQKMTELIESKSNRLSPEDIAQFKTELQKVDVKKDEDW